VPSLLRGLRLHGTQDFTAMRRHGMTQLPSTDRREKSKIRITQTMIQSLSLLFFSGKF